MFERFTQEARTVVVGAQQEARSLGHGWIGTEHLLLSVLADASSDTATALGRLGLDHETVRERLVSELGSGVGDDEALRDLGIDLAEVRRRVEERFGPGALADRPDGRRGWWPAGRRKRRQRCDGPTGHIPFDPQAKKALELALREALAAHDRDIRSTHLVLGLMRQPGMATRLVTALGVEPGDVRKAVLDLSQAA
jgi:ATP-dependent Clp protease ATP-binding subunit ClpA